MMNECEKIAGCMIGISLPRIPSGTDCSRSLRRSQGTSCSPGAPGKKLPAGPVGESGELSTITRSGACAISPVATLGCTWSSRSGVSCRSCGTVKQETLNWLADNPFYTKRFAFYVGRRCGASTIQDVARELRLNWKTVKTLEIEYMREQLRRAGTPGPSVIGIDEISIGRWHSYRIIVSDLVRGRPIWFGGEDRSEASMDEFFTWLGSKKCRKIRLAVMDMWKAFRKSTLKEGHAPQARIIYDKFHVLKHLGVAMDEVRKQEYARLSGKDRRFIKGQKYNLLARWENLTIEGKQALKLLFGANRRLNKAYLLKESFGQLWDYNRPGWARRFFNNWKDALKWQRLEPFCKFAAMVDAHWDGIEAYCHEENKVPLGFVEGINNKIRVIQRRAYGLRDEEYLRLKILTCTLPEF